MNKVILLGNLTRDPETRETSTGGVCKFSLAVNGYKENDVMFIDIVSFGKAADVCGRYLTKGSQCLVEGRLNLNQWETDDGNRRQRHEVIANHVTFIRDGKGGKDQADPGPEEKTDSDIPF